MEVGNCSLYLFWGPTGIPMLMPKPMECDNKRDLEKVACEFKRDMGFLSIF